MITTNLMNMDYNIDGTGIIPDGFGGPEPQFDDQPKKKRNTQSYKTLYEDQLAEVSRIKNKCFVYGILTISEAVVIITLLLSR